MQAAIWNFFSFGIYRSPTASNVTAVIILWVLLLFLIFLIGFVAYYILHTIYRVIAYDYREETYTATVTDKEYEPASSRWVGKTPVFRPEEFNVYITTDNGLTGVIDDEELYDWSEKGKKLQVTMKVGVNNRKDAPEIKYWRIIQYSW